MPARVKLELTLEEVVVFKAVTKLAQLAVSGYNVRAASEREVVAAHLNDLLTLTEKANHLEEQREFMSKNHDLAEGRKYLHVSVSEEFHERVHAYVLKAGGGKVRVGALGRLIEKAVGEYLDRQEQGVEGGN